MCRGCGDGNSGAHTLMVRDEKRYGRMCERKVREYGIRRGSGAETGVI